MKKLLLLFLTCFTFHSTWAQVNKASYDKAVDYLNCQATYYSLSVISSTKGVTNAFTSQCNCDSNPSNKEIISAIPKSEKFTVSLSQEINSLKKKDISKFSKQEVINFLTNGIFVDSNETLVKFEKDLKQKNKFSDFINKVKTGLAGIIKINDQKVVKQNNIVNQPNIEGRVSALENKLRQQQDKSWFSGITIYLILLAVLLSAVALWLGLRKQNYYDSIMPKVLQSERLRRLIQEESRAKGITTNSKISPSELRDANYRIRDLESQIEKIKAQLSNVNLVSNIATAQTTQATYQEINQPEVRIETFFLSTPNSDGSFNDSSASSSYKEGASIYRFNRISSNRAKFQIDEKETSIKLAIQYPDKNIDPVCEAKNSFNPNAPKIVTHKQGEAELQDGKWKVITKAEITYEL